MKHQSFQKLFAFIITVMMLSGLPQFVNAQKVKQCPKGYKYECYYYSDPWGGRGSWFCMCVPHGNGNQINNNSASLQSTATHFELEHTSIVSIKIYDATGRLIKTLANRNMTQGDYQIEWNKKDEKGNPVSAGIYILRFDAGNYSDTKRLSII